MDELEPTVAGELDSDAQLQLTDLNFDVIYNICSYLPLTDLIACQFLTNEFSEAATIMIQRKYQHLRLEPKVLPYQNLMTSTIDKVNMATLLLRRIGCWVTTLTIYAICDIDDLNQAIAEYCPQLIELSLIGTARCGTAAMKSVVPFRKVQTLKMTNWLSPLEETDESVIKFNIDSCPNLEKLILTGVRISRLRTFCGSRLKELSLNMVRTRIPSNVSVYHSEVPLNCEGLGLNTFSKLEVLRLHQCSESFDALAEVMANCLNLKYLAIVTDRSNLTRLCQSLHRLEQLDIALNESDSDIVEIGKLIYLKKLNIFFRRCQKYRRHNDGSINKLIQSLANRNILQEFRISVDITVFTVDTIEACRLFTQLKRMTIQREIFIAKDSLLTMCSAIGCLDHLYINYKQADLTTLERLLIYMQNLRSLRVCSMAHCNHLNTKKTQPMLAINYVDPTDIEFL